MSPQSLARTIDELILAADEAYGMAIGKVQGRLYNQLVTVLKELELDSEGYILQNTTNRKILSTANDKINEVFKSSLYVSAVNNYIQVIPKIDLANVQYFTGIDDGFRTNRVFLKSLQADTIATVERYILRDGLQSQVISPLSQILSQNVNTGGQFSGFLEQIKMFVQGDGKVDGRAMAYTKTYLRDTLFTYSRTFQQAITRDLKLEYYAYVGGLIETSRDFCRERSGKFFSHKEVESWADLEWSGKKAGTTKSSIFMYAAGWNCSHEIIPVHISIVPQDVIDRNN